MQTSPHANRDHGGHAPIGHAVRRKPYHKPTLTEFGDIQELTQGGSGIAPDFGGTTPNKTNF